MTTFNTVEELLDILDSNPRLMQAARYKILTEELIRLPQEFEEFRKGTEKSFTGINERLDAQRANCDRQNMALDLFRGAYAMEGTRRYRRDIARTIARGRGNRLLESVVLDDADLNSISVTAQDLYLSDTFGDVPERVIYSDFDTADLILKVTENNREKTEFYVAIEASFTIHDDDITKSTRVAKFIQTATGTSAFAVVAGAHINQDVAGVIIQDENEFIRVADPDSALWYEVKVRDLQPDPPRSDL